MGIFSRVRDIINSNLNAMLDKAEDPEKLIKLMIQEMEDTLVEVKASCAGVMATKKKIQRELDQVQARADDWADKAQLAVDKGREDLAREALQEKRRFVERAERLALEMAEVEGLIEQYQSDIIQLEEKLGAVREKQRLLVQRHISARRRRRAREDIRRAEAADAMIRFEQFENRIERLEAEAELVNFGRRPPVEDEFARLEDDEEIEKELQALKTKSGRAASEKKAE